MTVLPSSFLVSQVKEKSILNLCLRREFPAAEAGWEDRQRLQGPVKRLCLKLERTF